MPHTPLAVKEDLLKELRLHQVATKCTTRMIKGSLRHNELCQRHHRARLDYLSKANFCNKLPTTNDCSQIISDVKIEALKPLNHFYHLHGNLAT